MMCQRGKGYLYCNLSVPPSPLTGEHYSTRGEGAGSCTVCVCQRKREEMRLPCKCSHVACGNHGNSHTMRSYSAQIHRIPEERPICGTIPANQGRLGGMHSNTCLNSTEVYRYGATRCSSCAYIGHPHTVISCTYVAGNGLRLSDTADLSSISLGCFCIPLVLRLFATCF